MIPLTTSQLDALQSADRLLLASMLDRALYVGARDVTQSIRECDYEADEDPGVVLEASLHGYLEDLEGERIEVYYSVDGEYVLAYKAEVVEVAAKGYETGVWGGTPSYHAERIPLGEDSSDDLEYVSAAPSSALYEVASRLDYRGVDIPDAPRPRFTRTLDETLRWTDSISDAYEAIRDETGLALRDTPLSGCEGYPERSILFGGEPVWTFTEGVDFDFGELEVQTPEERYARVIVYRALEDGTHQRLESAEVENHGLYVRQDSALLVELTDEDGESAFDKAYTEARRLQDNALALTFPCVYPPFWLTRGDQVRVLGREITPEGIRERLYRARLTGVGVERRSGTLKAVGRMMGVEAIEAPKRDSERPR